MPAVLVYVQDTYQDDPGWPVFCPDMDVAEEFCVDWGAFRMSKGKDMAWRVVVLTDPSLLDQGMYLINKE